jgi:hypothetical protein
MALKSYRFDEKFLDLVALSEYEPYIDAFAAEFENLMAEAMADDTPRRAKWLKRLRDIQARQLDFKMAMLSLHHAGKNDSTRDRIGWQVAAG